jgi:hypothetical protein
MSSTDESILSLLLRAHRECAAQAHGEEYVHHNIPAKCDYDMALGSIESAIQKVHFAECSVRVHEAITSLNKERKI